MELINRSKINVNYFSNIIDGNKPLDYAKKQRNPKLVELLKDVWYNI